MSRQNRAQRIWRDKPCIFCGGHRLAQGIEHAPPKIIFKNKQRAKGFEFPACDRCNGGSSRIDQLFALLALSQAPEALSRTTKPSDYDHKVINGTANNSPFLYQNTKPVLSQDRFGKLTPAHQIELRPEVSSQAAIWVAKQTLALWYEHTGQIASHRAIIEVDIFTNARMPEKDIIAAIRSIRTSGSLGAPGETTSKQFCYKIDFDCEKKWAAVFARYHSGFGFMSILNDRSSAKLSKGKLKYRFGSNAHRGIYRLK